MNPHVPLKIPKTFTGFLHPYPIRPLTEDETKALMQLMMAPPGAFDDAPKKLEGDFAFGVMSKRLQAYKVPVEIRAMLFALMPCENPGHCVAMAWTLAKIYAGLKREVVMDDLVMGPFANGLPDTSGPVFGKMWDQQKGFNNGMDCDNLLDCAPWPHLESGS
jgi:hypothetical protein